MRILTYHKILRSSAFEKQIQYLSKRYHIVSSISSGNNIGREKLIITVDDGDLSFYKNAFPILRKYNVPAILFVITDLLNTDKPFWWDEIEYYLGREEGNKKVWEIKVWPNQRRDSYLKKLREESDKPLLKYKQLTTDQLKEMQEGGIVIANHSHTHPMFDKCTPEELEFEMHHSTSVLNDLRFASDLFAYPNGNYSPESEAVLKKYGIKQAFLFDHKINKGSVNPLRISRLVVNDTTPIWKFKLILSGLHTKVLPFTRFVGGLTGKLRK